MDKWIRNPNKPMMARHVAMRGHKRNKTKEKRTILLAFWLVYVQWREKSNSRERKSNFSLDFLVFGPSDFVWLRSKVVLHGKGFAWTPILWSFDNFKR